jgi:hypothetical protein
MPETKDEFIFGFPEFFPEIFAAGCPGNWTLNSHKLSADRTG